MLRTGTLLLGVLWIVLGGCGKTQEPPGYEVLILSEDPAAAPIVPPATDLGILQDPAQYKPATVVGVTPAKPAGPTPAAEEEAGQAEDPTEMVRELVKNLLDDLESGEIDLVLKVFEPEQIEVLQEDYDFLFETAETFAELEEALEDLGGETASEGLSRKLRELVTGALTVEVVDAETVTVKPNPLVVVLGPELASETLTVKLVGDEWKVHLDQALGDEDVRRMAAFHEGLQEALASVTDKLLDKDLRGMDDAYEALLAAFSEAGKGKAGEDEDYIEIDGQKIPKRPVVPKP